MTDNDYIAEYVKERKPEVIRTREFFEWKVARYAANAAREISDLFAQFMNEDSKEAAGNMEETENDKR